MAQNSYSLQKGNGTFINVVPVISYHTSMRAPLQNDNFESY